LYYKGSKEQAETPLLFQEPAKSSMPIDQMDNVIYSLQPGGSTCMEAGDEEKRKNALATLILAHYYLECVGVIFY